MLNSTTESPSIKLELDTKQYTILLSDLKRAHEAIAAACAIPEPFEVRGIMSDKNLTEHELTYTMRFARELDMFLFSKNPSLGACYHQAVTRCRENDMRKVDK